MPVTWAGWPDPPAPYPDVPPGARSRILGMPVLSPLAVPRPVKLKERKSPGDPACPECVPRRACAIHRDYRHKTDPLAGIG